MYTKKPTPREQKSAKTKQRIYTEAMKLFKKYGYGDTTIQDICKASGVSNGVFYHYYGSKNALFFKIAHEINDVSIGYLALEPERLANPLDSIMTYFLSMAHIFDEIGCDLSNQLMSLFDQIWKNPDGSFSELSSAKQLQPFIKAAQEYGSIDDSISPGDLAYCIYSAALGMVFAWILDNGTSKLVDLYTKCFPILLCSLKKTDDQ